jgi:hypothetical protein
MKSKQQIIKHNKRIKDAIFVSQMMELPGFKVFEKYLLEKKEEIRFQDIFQITKAILPEQKGIALGIEDSLTYFEQQKRTALHPMIDEETGEVEVLNKKKKKTIPKG